MFDRIYVIAYINVMIETETFLKMLADTTRLRCLMLLQLQGELCVCELTHTLSLSQPMISRHLALLRDNGLVDTRRAGQWMYYSIKADLVDWAKLVLDTTAQSNRKISPFSKDLKILKSMPNRPGDVCCS